MKTYLIQVMACAATLSVCCSVNGGATTEPRSVALPAKVAKVSGMDRSPVAVKKILPDYPRELRDEGVQGMVTVEMVVDSTGTVVAVELVQANVRELAPLALAAAKEWTFTPASAKGRPITTRVRVPFEFVLPQLMADSR